MKETIKHAIVYYLSSYLFVTKSYSKPELQLTCMKNPDCSGFNRKSVAWKGIDRWKQKNKKSVFVKNCLCWVSDHSQTNFVVPPVTSTSIALLMKGPAPNKIVCQKNSDRVKLFSLIAHAFKLASRNLQRWINDNDSDKPVYLFVLLSIFKHTGS